jgi:hypothetical protein
MSNLALMKKLPRRYPSMDLGLNSGTMTYWEPLKFANLVRSASNGGGTQNKGNWFRLSGTGAYTDDHGVLTTTNATDEFGMFLVGVLNQDFPSATGGKFISGTNLPSTVEIRWSGDGLLKIAKNSTGTAYAGADYTASGTYTVNLDSAGTTGGIFVFFKGNSLTDLKVIPTVWKDSHDGTNGLTATEWSPDYIRYINSLGVKYLRHMDAVDCNVNKETVWTDRILPAHLVWGARTPWEILIELSNRTKTAPWLNILTRANDDYVTQLGSLIKNNLSASLKVMLEYLNECWNTANPFGAQTAWVKYLNHTRYSATVTYDVAGSIFTYDDSAVSLSNGDQIICFRTSADYIARKPGIVGAAAQGWPVDQAAIVTVTKLSANTFTVAYSGSTIAIAENYAVNDVLFIKVGEAGKSTDLNANYVARSEEIWDALETVMPRDQMEYIIGSQHNAPTMMTARLAALSDTTRCNWATTAPYHHGVYWGVAVTTGVTVATPKAKGYENHDDTHGAVNYALYLATDTPTQDEIMAGTGAIATGAITGSYAESGVASPAWASGTEITGLTDGTQYKMYFYESGEFLANTGRKIFLSIPFTTGSVATTATAISNTDALEANLRYLMTKKTMLEGDVAAAAAYGVKHICYEGGPHMTWDLTTELETALYSFWNSNEFLTAQNAYFHMMAHVGSKKFMWYKAPSSTEFGTGFNNYVMDNRGTGIQDQNGKVRKYIDYPANEPTDPTVLADPGAFPHTLSTINSQGVLDCGAISHSIISGNDSGMFAISGQELQMLNNGGLNYSTLNEFPLVVKTVSGPFQIFSVLHASLGDPGYLNLANAAYTPQPLWQFASKATIVDQNPESPDGRSFVLHKTTVSGQTKKFLDGLFSTVIPAGGKFTVHYQAKANDIQVSMFDSGFYTAGTTTKIASAISFTSTPIAVGTEYTQYAIEFTNSSAVDRNTGTSDRFVFAFWFNDNTTNDYTADIRNFYITIP